MRILFEAILSPPLELEVQYSFSLYPCFDLLILEEKLESPCLVQCLTVLTSHCMPFCASAGSCCPWFQEGLVRGESSFNGPRLGDVSCEKSFLDGSLS